MKIGITELIVIFIVALFVIGPDKLPEYARKFGEALAQFRMYSNEVTKDIKESIVEPLEEAQKPLKEAIEPVQELDRELRKNVSDVQSSFANIGKDKPAKKGDAAIKEAAKPEKAAGTGGDSEEADADADAKEAASEGLPDNTAPGTRAAAYSESTAPPDTVNEEVGAAKVIAGDAFEETDGSSFEDEGTGCKNAENNEEIKA